MTNADVLQELKKASADLIEALAAAEKELAEANYEIAELRDELDNQPDPDDEGTTAEDFELVLEKIHYTTPGLRDVLIRGGADRNDIAELLLLLDLPVE